VTEAIPLHGESLAAHEEVEPVPVAERARHPTERAMLERLRDDGDAPLFEQEWRAGAAGGGFVPGRHHTPGISR
jgi:hypothetical protein